MCIHAHFYQPPRENPWIDEVETEESAAPFHDWNERITRECYGSNTASRILKDGKILEIVSNYEKISFNFGPTLLTWLERHKPKEYEKIISADRISAEKRGGHGNAVAQVYNHSIMPLNGKRDKETQIIWGIKDFLYRFGRQPEGIWFAETAIDRESLLLAAKHGIKFTILAPHQAKRIRPIKPDAEWETVENEINTRVPYIYRPDGENEIAIFFYDGALSHSIAFGGGLNDGHELGRSITSAFKTDENKEEETNNPIINLATDGESYGHHHRFGEMALSAILEAIEAEGKAALTNYGEYLEKNRPTVEVDIHENSSWSCAHGVERWKSDCGCSVGAHGGWNQKWREPLRGALNALKEKLDAVFEEGVSQFIKSPWDARNGYIDVLTDRGKTGIYAFIEKYGARPLEAHQVTETMKYFEMQVAAMKMFTSCGWFFNDVSGLETIQILKYAARAIDLAQQVSLIRLEDRFIEDLSKSLSNVKEIGTGADLYESRVRPLRVDPRKIAAHKLIINALRREEETTSRIYSYELELLDRHLEEYLDTMLMVGRLRLQSSSTLETQELVFCLLHFGGHDVNCALHPFLSTDIYERIRDELLDCFRKHSMPDMIHAVEEHFGHKYYTIKALFRDERKKVVEQLLTDRISRFGEAYQSLFEENSKLMDFFADVNVPMPEEFMIAAKYVFEKRLNTLFLNVNGDGDGYAKNMGHIMDEAAKWKIKLSYKKVEKNIDSFLKNLLTKVSAELDDNSAMVVVETLRRIKHRGMNTNLWEMQNMLYPLFRSVYNPTNEFYRLEVSKPGFVELFKALGFALPAA
ncbi:MAG: glycoside hydrolase [bacterium]|nr:MAG: glycoside hydrolase [bacterium]